MDVSFLPAGSKIICKDDSNMWGGSRITAGNVYVLLEDYHDTDNAVRILDDLGIKYGFFPPRFVVHEDSRFKQHVSDIEQDRKKQNWGLF